MDHAAQELITRLNEQTRELIVRDIDALERKLNVKRQVSMKADAAMDKVKGTLGMNQTHSDGIGGFVRHNAAPLLAVGVGGAILARNARQQAMSTTHDSVGATGSEPGYVPFQHSGDVGGTSDPTIRDRVGSVASDVQSKASDGLGSAKEMVSGAADTVTSSVSDATQVVGSQAGHAKDVVVERIPSREQVMRTAQDHSQLFGLAALAAGALAGTFIPRSRAEERRIAPVQAQVKEKATELVEDGVEKVKETADRASEAMSAAAETAKEEFQDSGEDQPPDAGSSSDDVTSSMPNVTLPNRITGSAPQQASGADTVGTTGTGSGTGSGGR